MLRWHYAPESIPTRKQELEKKVAKTRESPPEGDPIQVNYDGPAPSTPRPAMDPSLCLAAKLDRLMAEMSPWAREWAIRWLMSKYPFPRQDSDCNMPPL